MKKKHKRLFIPIIALVLIAISVSLFVRNRKVKIRQYSFSEMRLPNLSSVPRDNIINLLDKLYIENDKICGFACSTYKSVDLYYANSMVSLASILPDCDMNILKNKLKFLSNQNLENLDFLNLTYYIDLCTYFDWEMDFELLSKELKKYYDANDNLFFISNESDTINTKLIATATLKRVLKNDDFWKQFNIEEGIRKAFDNYEFLTKDDVTFYNSGGDIIYCISVFGMTDLIDVTKLSEWFKYWENIYNGIEINSFAAALQYSEFLNIAKVFQTDYSEEKLIQFYNNITEQNLNNGIDFYVIYNVLKQLDTLSDKNVNDLLSGKMMELIDSDSFVALDLDIKSTAYGVLMAQYLGFEYDEDKIKEYVRQTYSRDVSSENTYERSTNLYYCVILDQLVNNYEVDYDVKYLQKEINGILKDIDYSSDSLVPDIVSTRRLVDLVSDLQIFGADINISLSRVKKIQKGIRAALQKEEIKNSVIINDIFVISEILSLNEVSEETLIDIFNKTTIDGGTKAIADSEVIPDMISTYQFFSSFSMINRSDFLEEQKAFVKSLQAEDGIFFQDKNSTEIDLSVIAFGNGISITQIGGDALDKDF